MELSAEALVRAVGAPSFEGAEPVQPNLAAARKCVDWMLTGLMQLNRAVGFEGPVSGFVTDLVLSSASQAALFWRRRLAEEASTALVQEWLDQSLIPSPRAESIRTARAELIRNLSGQEVQGLHPQPADREFLLLYSLAVSEKLRAETSQSQARQSLRSLLSRLDLSATDAAQMLRVSAADVERWESGERQIPTESQALLNRGASALTRLSAVFRPERLPQVIRRAAPLFDGQSALEWILQGRIGEVAAKYESVLLYQG